MKTVCFGEIMLRLCPPDFDRFVQSDSFSAAYGGSEANTAVSLANFGIESAYVTILPAHEIGQAAVNSLRRYGVDTSAVNRKGARVGIYYLEKGASHRPAKVIYDRANSAFALAERSDFDWDCLLEGADLFHFSGITPAIGGNLPAICLDALTCAKKKNITVSCDINYRKTLWTYAQAMSVLTPLMKFVDILIVNEEHADNIFGIRGFNPVPEKALTDLADYEITARLLAETFSLKKAVITLRRTISADNNAIAAVIYDAAADTYAASSPYNISIIDRVGAGDAFGAGIIYGTLQNFTPAELIEFAAAANALKHTINGDASLMSADETKAIAIGKKGEVMR